MFKSRTCFSFTLASVMTKCNYALKLLCISKEDFGTSKRCYINTEHVQQANKNKAEKKSSCYIYTFDRRSKSVIRIVALDDFLACPKLRIYSYLFSVPLILFPGRGVQQTWPLASLIFSLTFRLFVYSALLSHLLSCLSSFCGFSVVTARGHSTDNKRATERIKAVLTQSMFCLFSKH